MQHCLLLLLLVPAVFCGKLFGVNSILEEEDLEIHIKMEKPHLWSAEIGGLCMVNDSFPYPTDDPTRYIECIQPREESDGKITWNKEWKDLGLGVYTLKECTPGTVFFFRDRICRTQRYIRRQAAKCLSGDGEDCPKTFDPTRRVRMQQCNTCAQQTYQPVYQQAPQPQVYQPPVQQVFQPAPQPVYQPQPVQSSGCGCQTTSTGACPCNQQPIAQPVIQPVIAQPVVQPRPTGCGCPTAPTGGCPSSCPQQPTPVSTCGSQCGGQQQQSCCQQVVQQPQPCPNAQSTAQNARIGTSCSWMMETLAPHPSSQNMYLQCNPRQTARGGSPYCGQWCPRPCPQGTTFDRSTQVCVRNPAVAAPIFPQQPAPCGGGCQQPQQQSIGSCNQNLQCPGNAQCQVTQVVPQVQAQPQSQCSSCCVGGQQGFGKK